MATLTAIEIGLTDATGLVIGSMFVDERQPGLVRGQFQPGVDYPSVEPLFQNFAELVEDQCLSLTDHAADEINKLGLLAEVDGVTVSLHDVQIYADGAASFRYPSNRA